MKAIPLHIVASAVLFVWAWTESTCAFAQTNLIGSQAPTPILVKFDGQYKHLAKLFYPGVERPREPRGTVVLNFMGLKCAPCRKELPMLFEVVRPAIECANIAGKRLSLFLVSIDPLSAKDELREFLVSQQVNIENEVLLDPYRKAAVKFNVAGIPRTFVISPEGRITADITGAVDDYKKLLQNGIEAAIKSKGTP